MNFKIRPFRCTNCGRSLLIDQMTIVDEGNAWNVTEFQVKTLLDYDPPPAEKWLKPEWRGMGRKELIQKIYALRHEIRELEYKACPWWKKPFHKDRTFI